MLNIYRIVIITAIALLLGVICGDIMYRRAPKSYYAIATVMLDSQQTPMPGFGILRDTRVDVYNRIEILKSEITTDEVAQQVLADPARFPEFSRYFDRTCDTPVPSEKLSCVSDFVRGSLSVRVAMNANSGDILMSSPFPGEAADLLNVIMTAWISTNKRISENRQRESVSILTDRLDKTQKAFFDSQAQLEAFFKENPSATNEAEVSRLVQSADQLDSRLLTLKSELASLEASLPDMTPGAAVGTDLTVRQQQDLAAMRGDLLGDEYRRSSDRQRQRAKVRDEMIALQKRQREIDIKIRDLPPVLAKLSLLKRDLDSKERMVVALSEAVTNNRNSMVSDSTGVLILNKPKPVWQPHSPRRAVSILLGAGIGVAIALGGALLMWRSKQPFRPGAVLGLKTAGNIPRFRHMMPLRVGPRRHLWEALLSPKVMAKFLQCVPFVDRAFFLAERSLADRPRLLCLCSAEPAAGKSHISLAMAVALATRDDRKVLLVDLDVWKRTKKPFTGAGLRQTNKLASADHYTLTSVAIPFHDGCVVDVLSFPEGARRSGTVDLALETLKEPQFAAYNHVVIDSPPFAMFADALNICRAADLAFIVIPEGETIESVGTTFNEMKVIGMSERRIWSLINRAKSSITSGNGRYYRTYAPRVAAVAAAPAPGREETAV